MFWFPPAKGFSLRECSSLNDVQFNSSHCRGLRQKAGFVSGDILPPSTQLLDQPGRESHILEPYALQGRFALGSREPHSHGSLLLDCKTTNSAPSPTASSRNPATKLRRCKNNVGRFNSSRLSTPTPPATSPQTLLCPQRRWQVEAHRSRRGGVRRSARQREGLRR